MNTALCIAVSGASGLIGRALVRSLATDGHQVLRLVRRDPAAGEIAWDPERGLLDRRALEGVDAVVHLAGENVGARWSAARRHRIMKSRIDGTRLIAETIASLRRPPAVLVSASAIGYYGAHDSGPLDEKAPPGDDFLARVCVEWEAATAAARERGIRVVHPRFGVVLSPEGGALKKLLGPFSLGLGGRLGSGRQPMSWIALGDAVAALRKLLSDESLGGAVNVVAPHPVDNAELTATLGRLLRRPAVLPLPSWVVRLMFGEMGRTMLLGGTRVLPRRLADHGFAFDWPTLEPALHHLLLTGGAPALQEVRG